MGLDLPRAAPISAAAGGRWAVVVVAAGQLALALGLFGGVDGLRDDRAIVIGRHPLHLYHAGLGAAMFHERYEVNCFDPAFQAGCPKTPVFDGGCRPAELALIAAGGHFSPASYKTGLFVICGLVPVVFALAAWGAGSPPAGWVVAALGGGVVWWSEPVRVLLDAGNTDLLGVGLAGLLFVGVLPKYAAKPGPLPWALLALAGGAGWYSQPVVWFGLFPVGFLYYVAVAPRHGLTWHLGQVGAFAAGLGPNLWWLADWVKFWWLRQTGIDDTSAADWPAVLGVAADYADIPGPGVAAWAVLGVGAVGLIHAVHAGRRVATGCVVVAALLAVLLARLGHTWPALEHLSAGRAGTFAVAVFVLPAADVCGRALGALPFPRLAVAGLALLPALCGATGVGSPAPFPLGLTPDQLDLVAGITHHTTPAARILWEDPVELAGGWNWSALLPVYTARSYLGGLDPEAGVVHSYCGLRDGHLNGRRFADWTPAERADFARRYNVGWVACRTPQAVGWWAGDPTARVVGRYQDGGTVTLFALTRPASFVLSGAATIERMDRQKIVLTDVTPDAAGDVVLSLHYQPGLRAAPATVAVEPDKDAYDPVPMVKLKVGGAASRVVVWWENR